MDAYISNTVNILFVAVNIWLSVPISCPHFAYLWFVEQVLGLLSLEGIGTRPLLLHGGGNFRSVCFLWCKGNRSFPLEVHFQRACSKSRHCPKYLSMYCYLFRPHCLRQYLAHLRLSICSMCEWVTEFSHFIIATNQ